MQKVNNLEVYFSNHGRAAKFPWSVYHKPLLNDLASFLYNIPTDGHELLVIGPGELFEFDTLKQLGYEVSVLDIDPRVIERLKKKFGNKIKKFHLVTDFDSYPEDLFDRIYAKEVIEHIIEYSLFIKKLKGLLNDKGEVWISTPNYGFFLLPFLEQTILELIARFSGFSRRDIHPTRFNANSLKEAFENQGFNNVVVKEMFLKLSLTLHAKK